MRLDEQTDFVDFVHFVSSYFTCKPIWSWVYMAGFNLEVKLNFRINNANTPDGMFSVFFFSQF